MVAFKVGNPVEVEAEEARGALLLEQEVACRTGLGRVGEREREPGPRHLALGQALVEQQRAALGTAVGRRRVGAVRCAAKGRRPAVADLAVVVIVVGLLQLRS